MIFARELDGEEEAVAVGSQSGDPSLSIRHRRLRGPSAHGQLRDFGVEIDDAGRSALHFSLPLSPHAGLCSTCRGSSTSRSITSLGEGVTASSVTPSAEEKRCHAPWGLTAIIPARSAKDWGPSST